MCTKVKGILKNLFDRKNSGILLVYMWNILSAVCGIRGVVELFKDECTHFYWLIGLAVLCSGIALLNQHMSDRMTLELLWNDQNRED